MIGGKDYIAPWSSSKLVIVARNVGSSFSKTFTICMADKWHVFLSLSPSLEVCVAAEPVPTGSRSGPSRSGSVPVSTC